jgi:hypothetical protein
MKTFKKFFSGLTLLLTLPTLSSCHPLTAVVAQGEGELTFEAKNNWNYAAKVIPRSLIEQSRKDNIDPSWIGDPRRFQAIQVKNLGQKFPLYFIEPAIYCPEGGCQSQELFDLYHPRCNKSGGCAYFVYVEEKGAYRKVFDQQFWRQSTKDFLKVSHQLYQGVPACFELTGFDGDMWLQGLPEKASDQVFVSRYCYNGRDYVLQNLYVTQRQEK